MPDSPDQSIAPREPAISQETWAESLSALQELVEQQKREQEIRQIEADLEKQRIANAHDYSLQLLEAQLQDRQSERQAQGRNSRYGLIFAITALLLLCVFFGVAMWRDKDQIVLEIVKAVLYIATGGIGGWGLARGRKEKESTSDPPSSGQ